MISSFIILSGFPINLYPFYLDHPTQSNILQHAKLISKSRDVDAITYLAHLIEQNGCTIETRRVAGMDYTLYEKSYVSLQCLIATMAPLNDFKVAEIFPAQPIVASILRKVANKTPHRLHFAIFVHDVYAYGLADAVICRAYYDWDSIKESNIPPKHRRWMTHVITSRIYITLAIPGDPITTVTFR
jgi:hypothetical protein